MVTLLLGKPRKWGHGTKTPKAGNYYLPISIRKLDFFNSRNINLLVLSDATELMIQILLSFDVLHEWGLKKLSNGGDMR